MKYLTRLFLNLCCVTLLSGVVFSQDFGKVGTKWHYTWQSAGNILHLKFESIKDTVIKGKTTHKIIVNQVGFNPVFLYQNSDTVFQYSAMHDTFFTYLIFNKNKGDTLALEKESSSGIFQYRMIIDSVFTILIDGISLKQYKVRGIDTYTYTPGLHNEYIIDRIGSLDYFFTSNSFSLGNVYGPLRCYTDSYIDTNFTTLPCDYRNVTSIAKIPSSLSEQITIYPNPSQGFFTIEIPVQEKLKAIILYNHVGDLIFSQEILENSNKKSIDIKHLPTGLYIVEVYSRNKIGYAKVIRTR